MSVNLLAKRYARALQLSAEEAGVVDRIADQLESFATMVVESRELAIVLANPSFVLEERQKVVRALADRLMVHKVLRNFLLLLVERGRMPALTAIAREFRLLADAGQNILRGEVRSASAIGAVALRQLEQTLSTPDGPAVKLTEVVDNSILGGFRVRVGSHLYDATVDARFRRLRETIARTL